MTAAKFWAAQPFSYIVAYSFNRGPKLFALHGATVAAIEQTKQELQQARFMKQAKLLQKLRDLEKGITLKMLTDKQSIIDNAAEQLAVIS